MNPSTCSLSGRIERLEQVVYQHADELALLRNRLVSLNQNVLNSCTTQYPISNQVRQVAAPWLTSSTNSSSDPKLCSEISKIPANSIQSAPSTFAVKPASHLREPLSIGSHSRTHYASITLPINQSSPAARRTVRLATEAEIFGNSKDEGSMKEMDHKSLRLEGEHIVMEPASSSDANYNDNNNNTGTGKAKKRRAPTKRKTTQGGDTPETPKAGVAYRKMTDPERYHVFAAAMQAKALHGSVGARDQQFSKDMFNTTVEILDSTADLHGLKGPLMPGYTTIRGLLTKFYNTGYVSREIGGGGCLRWGCRLSGKGSGGKCLCHQKVRNES